MRERGDLLESAEVHGNFYGTPKKPVEDGARAPARRAVRHRLQGAKQADGKMRRDVVAVFVLPPRMAELKGPARPPRPRTPPKPSPAG